MPITKLRFLRESKNWSQEYVADKLNLSQTAYSKLESGKTKLTTERINELSELFDVANDYFLTNDLPIVNYNNGTHSYNNGTHSKAIFSPQEYYEAPKELYDNLIKSKDDIISILQLELEQSRKEKVSLLGLIDRLAK